MIITENSNRGETKSATSTDRDTMTASDTTSINGSQKSSKKHKRKKDFIKRNKEVHTQENHLIYYFLILEDRNVGMNLRHNYHLMRSGIFIIYSYITFNLYLSMHVVSKSSPSQKPSKLLPSLSVQYFSAPCLCFLFFFATKFGDIIPGARRFRIE